MMKRQEIKHRWDGLLALALAGIFALCILAVLLTGADAYRRLVDRDNTAYDRRTAVQYLATKVRQADRLGAVTVAEFDGGAALTLTESVEGEPYATRIYARDGYLWELFFDANAEMSREDGEKLLPCAAAEFEMEGDLLTFHLTLPDGAEQSLALQLRSGEEAAS